MSEKTTCLLQWQDAGVSRARDRHPGVDIIKSYMRVRRLIRQLERDAVAKVDTAPNNIVPLSVLPTLMLQDDALLGRKHRRRHHVDTG